MLRKTTTALWALSTLVLLISCTSLPEPSELRNTLVIGSVVKHGKISGVPSNGTDIGVLSWNSSTIPNRVTLAPNTGTAFETLRSTFPKSQWLDVPLVHSWSPVD